jgi:hypothetical protein
VSQNLGVTKKSMKTFENLTLRRKLASFSAVFPHDDNAVAKNITGIYDNILEFSRSISSRTIIYSKI